MIREALKLALEALKWSKPHADAEITYNEAITAIKEALAQPKQDGKCKYCTDGCHACDARKLPEQEPVAWEGGEGWESLAWELCADENGEDSCNELIWEGGPIPEPWGDRWMKYEEEAKRLIALVQKHTTPPQQNEFNPDWDEKLALTEEVIRLSKRIEELEAQPEQEPVLFSCLRCVTPKKCAIHGCGPNTWPSEAPPQRTWVGLTDEEIDKIYEAHHNQYGECESVNFGYERAIEAKLRSKND